MPQKKGTKKSTQRKSSVESHKDSATLSFGVTIPTTVNYGGTRLDLSVTLSPGKLGECRTILEAFMEANEEDIHEMLNALVTTQHKKRQKR